MNARIMLVTSTALFLFLLGALAAQAHDYWIYEEWTPPSGRFVTGVNGFIDDNNLLGRGAGKEYLFFIHGPAYCGVHTAYVYEVITTCPEGQNARTHPENKENPGAICDRTFVYVKSKPWGTYCSGHDNDFYVDDSGVYYGGSNNPIGASVYGSGTGIGWESISNCTIMKYDFDLNPIKCEVQPAASGVQDISFNKYRKEWWAGGADRKMYRFDKESGEWKYIFSYPDLKGSHHDGQEIVGANFVLSDMTFDAFIIYKLDACGKPSGEGKYYTYNDPYTQNVEVMGYGPNKHLWISGWDNGRIYEIGGGNIQSAFEDPDLFPELCKQIKGEWLEGAGNYSCCGDDTDPGEDFMNLMGDNLCIQTNDGWRWVGPKTKGQIFRIYYFDEVLPDCTLGEGNITNIYARGEAVYTDEGPMVCGDRARGYFGVPKLINVSTATMAGDEYTQKNEIHGFLCTKRGVGENASFPILECPGTKQAINTDPMPILKGPDIGNQRLMGDYRRVYHFGENATSAPDGRTYWCSSNATWGTSLDGDQVACDAASDFLRNKMTGFRSILWTGSRCCGEEGVEFYNDKTPPGVMEKGVLKAPWFGNGCWGGRPVRGFGKVERNVNDVWPHDILTKAGNGTLVTGSIMNMNGTFHACNASVKAALPQRLLGIVRTCRTVMNETCDCFCIKESDGACHRVRNFPEIGGMANHLIAYEKRDATCEAPCRCETELVNPRVLW